MSDGLLVMLITVLVMCAVCLLFVRWVLNQPMPGEVFIDEEQDEQQDDERSQRNQSLR